MKLKDSGYGKNVWAAIAKGHIQFARWIEKPESQKPDAVPKAKSSGGRLQASESASSSKAITPDKASNLCEGRLSAAATEEWYDIGSQGIRGFENYSRAAAAALRHQMSLDRDGGVTIQEFEQWMRNNSKWGYAWKNSDELIEKISQGCDKPRYEVQLDANNVMSRIRAIQGHSRPVEDLTRSLVRVRPEDAGYLWHATTERALPKILKSGILLGVMCK